MAFGSREWLSHTVERSLILTKALTLDETARVLYQQFHELYGFNIFLSRDVTTGAVILTAMAAGIETKSHSVL